MSNSDAYILVTIFAFVACILPCGIAFYPFLILRSQLVELSRGRRRDDPAGLFLSGLWRGFLWGLLFLVVLCVPCAGFMFLLFGGIGGFIGWAIVWFQGRSQRQALLKTQYVDPNLQLGMTDLYVGIFFYGTCMTLLLSLYPDEKDRVAYTLFWTFYLLVAQGFAFFVALDLLRHAKPPFDRGRRAKYLVGILLLSSLLLPLIWLVWKSWRYALRQAALDAAKFAQLPVSPALAAMPALALPPMPPPLSPPQPSPQTSPDPLPGSPGPSEPSPAPQP